MEVGATSSQTASGRCCGMSPALHACLPLARTPRCDGRRRQDAPFAPLACLRSPRLPRGRPRWKYLARPPGWTKRCWDGSGTASQLEDYRGDLWCVAPVYVPGRITRGGDVVIPGGGGGVKASRLDRVPVRHTRRRRLRSPARAKSSHSERADWSLLLHRGQTERRDKHAGCIRSSVRSPTQASNDAASFHASARGQG